MLVLAVLCLSLATIAAQADATPLENVTVLAREGIHVPQKAFVEDDHLFVPAAALPALNGFALKPEGLCADEICVPLPVADPGVGETGSDDAGRGWTRERGGAVFVDATAFAEHVGQPFARNEDGTVWSFAPVPLLVSPLQSGQAPDFELLDREGNAVRLEDFRGSKVLLLTWASW